MAHPQAQPEPTAAGKTAEQPWWPPPQGQWSLADYLAMPEVEGFRHEIIRGDVHMTPAPSLGHQDADFRLAYLIERYLDGNRIGRVFVAPTDVVLQAEEPATVVQPDVIFVRRENRGIASNPLRLQGAPDMVAEVLSPRTGLRDRRTKLDLYAQFGIGEYWLVDPRQRRIEVYTLRGDSYVPLGFFVVGERCRSQVLPGFTPLVEEVCRSEEDAWGPEPSDEPQPKPGQPEGTS